MTFDLDLRDGVEELLQSSKQSAVARLNVSSLRPTHTLLWVMDHAGLCL